MENPRKIRRKRKNFIKLNKRSKYDSINVDMEAIKTEVEEQLRFPKLILGY